MVFWFFGFFFFSTCRKHLRPRTGHNLAMYMKNATMRKMKPMSSSPIMLKWCGHCGSSESTFPICWGVFSVVCACVGSERRMKMYFSFSGHQRAKSEKEAERRTDLLSGGWDSQFLSRTLIEPFCFRFLLFLEMTKKSKLGFSDFC